MNSLSSFLAFSYFVGVSDAALRGSQDLRNIRDLQQIFTITGECTVANFSNAVGSPATLAGLLGVPNDPSLQDALTAACNAALEPTKDLSDTLGKGPQFLKNFLDGGTTWNDNYDTPDGEYSLVDDAAIIATVHDTELKNTVFATPDGGTSEYYPQYFSNFFKGTHETPLGAIVCCYIDSRIDQPLVGNAEMCALDMTEAAKSNHIHKRSWTLYETQDSDNTYCTGFAFESGSFGDSVKYNTLFHLAMKTNLYDNGYVKNIPGAPLCANVEQMPVIDNADCVKPIEGYTIDSNGVVGVNLDWEGCGADLKTYYNTLSNTDIMKHFVNTQLVDSCEEGSAAFMNEKMYVPISE